jgi:uncharacterized lipoprotein
MKKAFLLIILIILVSGCERAEISAPEAGQAMPEAEEYSPVINPSDFSAEITNKYFSMPVGKKMVY